MHTGSSWITARSTVSKKDLFFVVIYIVQGISSRLDFPAGFYHHRSAFDIGGLAQPLAGRPDPIYMQLELHNPWRLGHRARVSRRVDTRREMPRQASIRREAPRVERPTEMASISVLAAERFRHSHTDGTLRRASVRTPPSPSPSLCLSISISLFSFVSLCARLVLTVSFGSAAPQTSHVPAMDIAQRPRGSTPEGLNARPGRRSCDPILFTHIATARVLAPACVRWRPRRPRAQTPPRAAHGACTP